MSTREILGIALVGSAAVAAPTAYFLGGSWAWVALGLAVVGFPLFLTARVSRRWGKSANSGPDVGGELMGFPGHRVFSHSDRTGSDADDE